MATAATNASSREQDAPATESLSSHTPDANQPQSSAKPRRQVRKRKEEPAKEPPHVPKTRRPRGVNKDKDKDKDKDKGGTKSAAVTADAPSAPAPAPASSSRKKQKVTHLPEIRPTPTPTPASRQSKITDLVDPAPQSVSAQPSPPHSHQVHSTSATAIPLHAGYDPTIYHPRPQSTPVTSYSAPPPRTSGQHYDPVRAAYTTNYQPTPMSTTSQPMTNPATLSPHNTFSPPPNASSSSPNHIFRASASPAISSIIDPPQPSTVSTVPLTPAVITKSANTLANNQLNMSDDLRGTNTMEVDQAVTPTSTPTQKLPTPVKKPASGSHTGSRAQSPKPGRSKDAPLPSGSGLLTSAVFGFDAGSSAANSRMIPSIVLHVPLKSQQNVVVNFARLAEAQYGFEALHPRIAAQRERRARLAAASAALERNEKNRGEHGPEDDLTLDMDKDSDLDVSMGGMGPASEGSKDATEGDGRKRRKKIEDYDRDDPFVDDSEMAWEAQQAASKDGFFVYSGPLVKEGEKPTVERSDGTIKRGGRGRGGRGGIGGESRAAVAARVKRDKDTKEGKEKEKEKSGSTSTQAKPRSSRGGGIARKPRMTKADRAMMEKEKADREKMGMGLAGRYALGR